MRLLCPKIAKFACEDASINRDFPRASPLLLLHHNTVNNHEIDRNIILTEIRDPIHCLQCALTKAPKPMLRLKPTKADAVSPRLKKSLSMPTSKETMSKSVAAASRRAAKNVLSRLKSIPKSRFRRPGMIILLPPPMLRLVASVRVSKMTVALKRTSTLSVLLREQTHVVRLPTNQFKSPMSRPR